MSWLCWHIGTTTDPKFGAVTKRCSNVPKHLVVAVWAHLLECAFEAEVKGDISGVDTEDVAIALDCDEVQVSQIIEAMAAKGLIHNDKIVSWEKRQNGSSTIRVRKFRENKKRTETECNVSPVSETHETGTDRQTDKQTDIQTKKFDSKKMVSQVVRSATPEAKPSHPTNFDDPANRKARWQQKIESYLYQTLPDSKAKQIVLGYVEGEKWALEKYEEADRAMRARQQNTSVAPPNARRTG